jgi:PKD repeat protein
MSLYNTDLATITARVEAATDAQLAKATPPPPPPAGGVPVPLTVTMINAVALAYGSNWPSITTARGTSEAGNWKSWLKHYVPVPAKPGLTLAPDQLEAIVGLVNAEIDLRALPCSGRLSGSQSGADVTGDLVRTGGYPVNVSTVKWAWGDGETTEGTLEASHTYAEPGEYTVTVSWKDKAPTPQSGQATRIVHVA